MLQTNYQIMGLPFTGMVCTLSSQIDNVQRDIGRHCDYIFGAGLIKMYRYPPVAYK